MSRVNEVTAAAQPAVVLLSGGLDSATVLAIAQRRGHACYALSVAYGQRHAAELDAAARVAAALGAREHRVMQVDLAGIGGSALTDPNIAIPERPTTGIPVTYVPARNTMMLALALGWAEVLGARAIVIGVNAVDWSGYPDCRPEFIRSFESVANLATRAGVEGTGRFRIHAPLLTLDKPMIIERGRALGVDYSLTHSCYDPTPSGLSCGRCDACQIRLSAFDRLGIADPIAYASTG